MTRSHRVFAVSVSEIGDRHTSEERQPRRGQNDHVARLLPVLDQDLFARQLGDILLALDSGLEVYLAPQIHTGSRVRIKSGPLRGMEALVEERYGMNTVLLRLDFISQAAAIRLETTDLELL